jgi:phosphatidylserine/phosphatidylglycerophosphate/cardiolipin synthase-like enzyme
LRARKYSPTSVVAFAPLTVHLTLDAVEFYEIWEPLLIGAEDWTPAAVVHAAYRLSNFSLISGQRFRPDPTTFSVLKRAGRSGRVLEILGSAHITNPSRVAFWRLSRSGLDVRLRRPRDRPVGSAHEKFTVATDGATVRAIVASVDLTPARFDSHTHLKDRPSHETGLFFATATTDVMRLMIEDPPPDRVDVARSHADDNRPELHVVRSFPTAGSYRRTDFGFLATFLNAVQLARRYIYIEDQFFCPDIAWSRSADGLEQINPIEELRRAVARGVRLIVSTNDAFATTGQTVAPLKLIHRARSSAMRRLSDTPSDAPPVFMCKVTPSGKSIYTHSKLVLIDDDFLMIGSANISPRSFLYDNELSVVALDRGSGFVRDTRLRLWSEYTDGADDEIGEADFAEVCVRRRHARQIGYGDEKPLSGLQRAFYNRVVDPIVLPKQAIV